MSSTLSTNWIKMFLIIGIMATVMSFVFPVLLAFTFQREAARYVDCEEMVRQDCEPSFIWFLFDRGTLVDRLTAEADQEAATAEAASGKKEESRSTRSSATAPRILSVEPVGMMLDAGVYRAKAGTKITLNADVIDATKVELFVRSKASSSTEMKKLVALSKVGASTDAYSDTYTGSFVVQSGWFMDVEVRATNTDGETATVLLNMMAQ